MIVKTQNIDWNRWVYSTRPSPDIHEQEKDVSVNHKIFYFVPLSGLLAYSGSGIHWDLGLVS